MKSCVGGASGPKPGAAAGGAGAGAGAVPVAAAGATVPVAGAETGGAETGGVGAGAAAGAGPAAWTGSMPVGKCACVPGTTPGGGTWGTGPRPLSGATTAAGGLVGSATNWFTDVATFLDSVGAVGLWANAWAAAISSWVACCGLLAACWMIGLS